MTLVYRIFIFVWFLPFVFYLIPRPETHEYVKGYVAITPLFPGVLIYTLVGVMALVFGLFFSIPFYKKTQIAAPEKSLTEDDLNFAFKKSLIVFFLAMIGVLSSWQKIILFDGLESVLLSFALGTGNDFREILYEGYKSLPYGFRHLTGPSAAVLFFTALELKKSRLYFLLIVVVLLLNILITSRLTLILFAVVFAACYIVSKKKPSKILILSGIGFMFIVLMVTNYIRNVNYFESYGIYNPVSMLIIQIRQYIETAFVGALSFCSDPFIFPKGPYIQMSMNGGGEFLSAKAAYHTGIKEEFTQISGLLFLFTKVDILALLIFPIVLGAALAGYNYFVQFGFVRIMEVGILLYGVSDSWRTFIFFQGFFIINILTSILIHRLVPSKSVQVVK